MRWYELVASGGKAEGEFPDAEAEFEVEAEKESETEGEGKKKMKRGRNLGGICGRRRIKRSRKNRSKRRKWNHSTGTFCLFP